MDVNHHLDSFEGSKPTLEYALRPHAVPREEIVRRYRPVVTMVRQILGVVPHALGYLEIWPPAFTTYNVLVPALFEIPRCDLGMGISPDLRSLVAYVASRTHGCSYCAAHTAVIGTIFQGPGGSLTRNAAAMEADSCPMFESSDRAAIAYASAVSQIPHTISLEHRLNLARHHSARDEESIVLATALMGFLNCAMDTLGIVLEWQLINQAEEHLAPSNWQSGRFYVESFDADIVEADKNEKGETLGRFQLARTMAGVIAYDRAALRNIARRPRRIHQQLKAALGFVPGYFERIESSSAQRVLAHVLIERLQSPEGPVPPWMRYAMCFLIAKHTNNPLLCAHFAFLALRAGVEPQTLVDVAEARGPAHTPEGAVFALARAVASAPARVDAQIIKQLMVHHPPASIIQLVLVASIYMMLHRYTSTYPQPYEPLIQAFVAENGDALDLVEHIDKSGLGWDELVERARTR